MQTLSNSPILIGEAPIFTRNLSQTEPPKIQKIGVDAQRYYRLQELLMVRFSPEENDNSAESRVEINRNPETENPKFATHHPCPKTPPNAEIPFYIWLIDIVKSLWLRVVRLFRDFLC